MTMTFANKGKCYAILCSLFMQYIIYTADRIVDVAMIYGSGVRTTLISTFSM